MAAASLNGFAGHPRRRIRDIVLAEPPQKPVDRDYIVHIVERPVMVQGFFAEFAEKETWLDWLETQDVFLNNFNVLPLDEASLTLGRWFLQKFIRDLSKHNKALGIFQRHGPQLNRSFREMALSCVIKIMRKWRIRAITAGSHPYGESSQMSPMRCGRLITSLSNVNGHVTGTWCSSCCVDFVAESLVENYLFVGH